MEEPSLNLIEIFSSVQGETSFSGFPTTFVRLAQCNLRCTWCDTKYSYGRGDPYTIEQIISRIESNGLKYVCITGGEPLLQPNVHHLIKQLCDAAYVVTIETSGSLSIKEVDQRVHIILDIKCPGSKMNQHNHWENLAYITKKDEVKFVIADKEDYTYAKDVCKTYNLFEKQIPVLLSPVHGDLDSQLLVDWILTDRLPVRLNLQIHKFIWTPETRGV